MSIEKAELLTGAGLWSTRGSDALGIRPVILTDGPHGVRLQDAARDQLDLASSHPATCFPTASCLASSWDVTLLARVGEALGEECRSLGVGVLLGPGVNIKRSPLCGRNFEYFSEDPLLAGALGAAWVRGVQSRGVGTSVKHFAANNQETDRMRSNSIVDERTLREIYLRAFEAVVREASPATVMCSYNSVNGAPAAENRWLLTQVLRDEWGYGGLVVSDWGAVTDIVASVAAGLDLAMPEAHANGAAIAAATAEGSLDPAAVDRAVERLAQMAQQYGRTDAAGEPRVNDTDRQAHHELAREAAVRSMVLLKNDGGVLPLAPAGGTVAVIGELARTPRYQGAGSSQVNPTRVDVPLDALRTATNRGVVYEPGYDLQDDGATDRIDAAVEVARGAADVIVFAGLPPANESEGYDRTRLTIPNGQAELIRRVAAANPRTVVVLSNGGVVTMSEWVDAVPAVLETWLGGQAIGSAVADLIVGRANPSGKLAETIPLRLADTPAYLNFGRNGDVVYGERVYVGYRYYTTVGREVQFPFGHGLSYTTFELAASSARRDGDTVLVEVAIANTGARDGAEVVQLYVSAPGNDRPVLELVGFAKLDVPAGATATTTIRVPLQQLRYYSERHGRWLIEGGVHTLHVGFSSADLRASVHIELAAEVEFDRLEPRSTLKEWREHPTGRHLLAEALTGMPGFLDDPAHARLVEQIPLAQLLAFSGGADAAALRDLADRANAAASG